MSPRPPQPPEPGRCKHEMLPGQCGQCQGLAEAVDPWSDVLIERFILAQYNGKCCLVPAHSIVTGTTIGLAVYEDGLEHIGWCCTYCVERITA